MTGACLMKKLVGIPGADGLPGPFLCGVFLAWYRPVAHRLGSRRGKA